MPIPLFTNNAATALAVAITPTDSILQVVAGTGQYFPAPTGGNYCMLTLIQVNNPEVSEIVKCIGRTGDFLTVERGQENTQPQIFNISDNVQLRITAQSLNIFAQGGGGGGGGTAATQVAEFTATQGQTVFTIPFSYVPDNYNLAVFVNGSKQIIDVNYSESSSTSITFFTGLNVGDLVEVVYNLPIAAGQVDASNILYDQGGVGAVERNVQVKLQETVSVRDFGAVGNGSTDNTLAFQTAVNAVASTGGTVHVPGGLNGNQYLFTTQAGPSNPTITIPSNVHIVMDDDVYLLTQGGVASGVNGYNQAGSNQRALFVNSTPSTGNVNISITGGNIKSVATSAVGSALIALQNVKNVRVENVNLLDTWSACRMQFSYCTNVIVSGVRVDYENIHASPYSFEDGIRVGSGCYDVAISNCVINSGDDSIAINNEASETQNTLTSTSPFAYASTGASIQNVNITNVNVSNQAGNALRIYQGPGMTTGTISKVVVNSFNGFPKHPTNGWSTAVSIYDNSGSTTNAISKVTLDGFYIDCSNLGTSGTGTPGAIQIQSGGGDFIIANGSLMNVSVPFGVLPGYNTTINNVYIYGCTTDSIYLNTGYCSITNNFLEIPGRSGVYLASGAIHTIIQGNQIQSTTGAAITEAAGAGYTTAIGNNISSSGACSIANNGNSVYANNTGLNPIGTTTVGATSSPFTYTSAYTNETITIYGGTVSSITINGVGTGATNGAFNIPPNTSMVITYSVGPTITKTLF